MICSGFKAFATDVILGGVSAAVPVLEVVLISNGFRVGRVDVSEAGANAPSVSCVGADAGAVGREGRASPHPLKRLQHRPHIMLPEMIAGNETAGKKALRGISTVPH